MPRATCLRLERQAAWRAFSRAWAKTGKRIAARMAIIAITTSSSIRVKPRVFRTAAPSHTDDTWRKTVPDNSRQAPTARPYSQRDVQNHLLARLRPGLHGW